MKIGSVVLAVGLSKKPEKKRKKPEIHMKWGLQCSGPRDSTVTKFCRGGHIWTEIVRAIFGVSRFIGLGAEGCTNFGLPL